MAGVDFREKRGENGEKEKEKNLLERDRNHIFFKISRLFFLLKR